MKGYCTQYQPEHNLRVLFYSRQDFEQFAHLAVSQEEISTVYPEPAIAAEFEPTEQNRMLLALAGIFEVGLADAWRLARRQVANSIALTVSE